MTKRNLETRQVKILRFAISKRLDLRHVGRHVVFGNIRGNPGYIIFRIGVVDNSNNNQLFSRLGFIGNGSLTTYTELNFHGINVVINQSHSRQDFLRNYICNKKLQNKKVTIFVYHIISLAIFLFLYPADHRWSSNRGHQPITKQIFIGTGWNFKTDCLSKR